MYLLHDNGRKLFTSPHDCTPMQRFVYIMAKGYHTEDEQTNPSGMDKANQFNQSKPF